MGLRLLGRAMNPPWMLTRTGRLDPWLRNLCWSRSCDVVFIFWTIMLDRMVSVLSFRFPFRFRFDLSLFLCPSYQLAPPDVVNTVYMYVMIDCIITIFRVIYARSCSINASWTRLQDCIASDPALWR